MGLEILYYRILPCAEDFHLLIIIEQNITEISALTDFADALK